MAARKISRKTALIYGVCHALTACATNGPSTPNVSPMPPESSAAPIYSRSDLEGASADALDSLLGDPALTRREGIGEFRRYDLKDCSLIVILLPDGDGDRVARLDASAKRSGDPSPDLDACLARG